MFFSFLVVALFGLTVARNIKKDGSDPYWIPINPRNFAPAKPQDRITVRYMEAPLLEAEIGPVFKLFSIYHAGLAFTNHRTNFTFTTNYDSDDLAIFSSQLPVVKTNSTGGKNLVWQNTGSAFCYKDIHPHFWTTIDVVGDVNGTIYNQYMNQFLIPFNATWPYYEMFNVKKHHSPTNYVNSRECFDYAFLSLKTMNNFGAKFSGLLHRNLVAWYADSKPTIVDYNDPKTHASIIEFYEVLSLKWGKIKSFFGLLKELWEISRGKVFYYHAGTTYYEFKPEFPILGVEYVKRPIEQ